MIKTYKDFLKEVFPQYKKVRKVSLNAGLSCPNIDGTIGVLGCAYCNNKSFSAVANTELPPLEQLENGIARIKHKNKEAGILAYFQSYTNTHAPVQKLYEIFSQVISHKDVIGISIGTRPDCLQHEIIEMLAELNKIKPLIVEIGVQTTNNQTLKNINRGHTAECSRLAAEECKKHNIIINAHVIIGLPGETMEDFINTANFIKENSFSAVKIHPLHIVKNTQFEKEYNKGKIELLSMEAYCKIIAKFISIIQPNTEENKVAVERFCADSLGDTLIAPLWSCEREKIRNYLFSLSDFI